MKALAKRVEAAARPARPPRTAVRRSRRGGRRPSDRRRRRADAEDAATSTATTSATAPPPAADASRRHGSRAASATSPRKGSGSRNRSEEAPVTDGRRDARGQARCRRAIRDVPDWPSRASCSRTSRRCWPTPRRSPRSSTRSSPRRAPGAVDKVVGIEARGFILGAPVAYALGVGFVPVRKKGKLPGDVVRGVLRPGVRRRPPSRSTADAFAPGDRVLVVDDVLATGGTAAATVDLVRRARRRGGGRRRC